MCVHMSWQDRKAIAEGKKFGNLFADQQGTDREKGIPGLTNQAVVSLIKKGVYTKDVLFGDKLVLGKDGCADEDYYDELEKRIKQEKEAILKAGAYKERKW